MQSKLARRAVLGLGLGVIAQISAGARAAPADAIAPVQGLNAGLLAIMRAGKAVPFARRFDMLAPAVDQAFDLDAILQSAVGPRWSALAETDKAGLRVEFRRFSIASWVVNFDSFSGEVFTVQPEPRALGDGGLVVETQFGVPGGTPVRLSYVMRQGGGRWRAADILAEGTISRVAVLRSDFRQVLAQGGGAALLVRLRDKTEAMFSGKAE